MTSYLVSIFLIGISTFGGGAVFIPLLNDLIVKKSHLLTLSEFSRVVAVVNSLPGPTGPKIVTYSGYLLGGGIGSILSLLVLLVPGMIIMQIAYKFHEQVKHSRKSKRINTYIKPIIIGIFLSISVDFMSFTIKQINVVVPLSLFLLSYLLLEYTRIKQFTLIIFAIIFGNVLYFLF